MGGFVRCDYCLCDCITHKSVASYKLKNLKYWLKRNPEQFGKTTNFKNLIAENLSNRTQVASQSVAYTVSKSVSLTTTTSLTTGLSLTVEAGVNIGILHSGYSVTSMVEKGFSTEEGKVETEERQVSDTVDLTVG